MSNGGLLPPISEGHDFGLNRLEKNIIALIVAGRTDEESAFSLGISARDVRKLLKSIFGKLEVANQVELVLFSAYHNLRWTSQETSDVTPQ